MPKARYKIVRSQSSLAPILNSSSKSSAERSVDLFTPLVDSKEEAPVQISVRNVRVITMAVSLTVGLGAIASVMIQGFTFTTLDAKNLTDTDKSELLDRYNTYTGALFSFLSMPFQHIVLLLMPVFFLCFATSAILSENKTFFQKWAPVGATVAASLLLSQGMNAVNVQFDSVQIESIIAANDLSSTNSGSFSFDVTNVTSSSSISGTPSTDTILRSAIRSMASDDQTTCTWLTGWAEHTDPPEASIRYGFALNSWLEYVLPTAVESEKSFKFSMNDEVSSDSASSIASEWELNDTAQLFSYGVSLSLAHYSDDYDVWFSRFNSDNLIKRIDTSNPLQMLTDMQREILNSSEYWTNISIPEMAIEFSSFQISPQIQFDSVTFELPVDMATMQQWMMGQTDFYDTNTSGSDFYVDIPTFNMGNEHALVFTSPAIFHDQLHVLKLCMKNESGTDIESYYSDCDVPVNTSVIIFSFAQHIAMDEWELFYSSGGAYYPKVRVTNPRKVYSITVGKLSWQTDDLSQTYDATCQAENNCQGLYLPLSNGEQHVVVGQAYIPNSTRDPYFEGLTHWQLLVASKSEMIAPYWTSNVGTRYHVDLIYPPLYPAAPDSLPWNLTENDCLGFGSGFINDVIQRHIYSKDPVQPAYTAGLFWLFQNAALYNIENPANSTSLAAVTLDFNGNIMWISPRVSMPRTSAILTLAGCLLVIIGGSLVYFWSRSRKLQNEFQRHLFSAHNVGDILFNTVQFPPSLLRTEVQQSTKEDTRPQDQSGGNLRAYTITEMTLRHQSESIESVVEIRPTDTEEAHI